MAERQVSVGRSTYDLPPLFLVMATQNPIEQAGTYPLPQAQLDRFMLHVRLDYPSEAEEIEILRRDRNAHHGPANTTPAPGIGIDDVLAARGEVRRIHVAPAIEDYIVALVRATREPGRWREQWARVVECGASPRASLALSHAACALAYLRGRDHVVPDDVQALAADVLRHRMSLHVEARLERLDPDQVIAGLLEAIPAP